MRTETMQFRNPSDLAERAAKLISDGIHRAVSNRGFCNVALAGGSTPRLLYERLSSLDYKDEIPWQDVYLFWGDERFSPQDPSLSNYNLAWKSLISKIKIPRTNVLPPNMELRTPRQCATSYQETILRHFERLGSQTHEHETNKGGDLEIPQFDIILLGMGPDGHTASLFPDHPVLMEKERLVVGLDDPIGNPKTPRITFTLPLINEALDVYFLVSGDGKAQTLKRILSEPDKFRTLFPSAMVQPKSQLYWLHDIQLTENITDP